VLSGAQQEKTLVDNLPTPFALFSIAESECFSLNTKSAIAYVLVAKERSHSGKM
jgi:hypothetical protein